jgi:hypothetical protein
MKPFKLRKLRLAQPGSTSEKTKDHELAMNHIIENPGTMESMTGALPGSMTGEGAVENAMGTPGQDYEASWGISVSLKSLKNQYKSI